MAEKIFPILDRPTLVDRDGTPELEPRTEFEEEYLFPVINWNREAHEELYSHFPKEIKKYFLPTTGVSEYDIHFGDKTGIEEREGWTFRVVMMRPERYKELTREGFIYELSREVHPDLVWDINNEKMDRLENALAREGRLPIPYLNYREIKGGFTQEGRHRTELMIRKGVDKIPVVVAWDVDDEPPIREVR